jgi:hypothetical protein
MEVGNRHHVFGQIRKTVATLFCLLHRNQQKTHLSGAKKTQQNLVDKDAKKIDKTLKALDALYTARQLNTVVYETKHRYYRSTKED